MMDDPYEEAKAIADLLDGTGLRERAEYVRRALVEGATGTEIYMILHWRLENIARDSAVPAELKSRVMSLSDYLERTLGP
jgi:hypothetical protein